MIEALKDNTLVDKIGGRFKLCALIQRRLQQLLDGERPLRSEEHTSELQSLTNLVCRLLLEKKKPYSY